MSECVFCGIARGEIDAEVVAEDSAWVAFRDLEPQAPVHVLVIPRRHVASLDALDEEGAGPLAAALLAACVRVARAEGLEEGYRVLTNVGEEGGQAIQHLHFHLLGGRRMGWPPG
ncbi:MAG: HIT domain-containing protein [Gemmatimonadota bacterium]|nr:HIT domain-containing protein [Gemmatimonadota bacterium]